MEVPSTLSDLFNFHQMPSHSPDVMEHFQNSAVCAESTDTDSQTSSRRKKKKVLTKKLTLFNRLVRSSLFQFMLGNLDWSEVGRSTENDAGKKYINAQQPLPAKALDLFLFGLLVLAAPFFALNNFLKSYWARFSFGAVCGVAVLFLAYQIVLVVWSQFNIS